MNKLLYVEDEPFLAKIVAESLRSRKYEVMHVEHGEAVLPILLNFKADLCLLDVMLPGKNGFEVGKELRKNYPDLPILYLTARTQANDIVEGFRSGGNDYLRKPFSMEELVLRIDNLIQLTCAKTVHTPNHLDRLKETRMWPLGSFKYYPDRFELFHDEKTCQLSYKEGQLMNILASQVGEIIERRHILKTVWNDDSYFNSRTLDVYIRKLRKYLALDPKVRILTLKGVGYRVIIE